MAKAYIKEAGIIILLVLAVTLLLAIILYDYIPNNKVVPIKLKEYTMPEEIQAELEEASIDEQNIVRTYYIDSSDLDLYESTNDYNKGKANPFADYSSDSTDSGNNTVSNSTSANSANVKSNETKYNGSSSMNTTDTNTNTNTNNNNSNANTNTSDDGEVYMTTPGKNY